jgi:hypothetical protein
MLTDRVTELLTAYVDGELGQRQRKAALRLLHRSSEARTLLRELQENAHRIKQLPRRKLQASLVNDVLQAIADRPMLPEQPVQPQVTRSWVKPYLAVSLAASVLIGAAGFIYWQSRESTDMLAENKPAENPTEQRPTPQPAPGKVNPTPSEPAPKLVQGVTQPVQAKPPFVATFRDLNKDPDKAIKLIDRLQSDKIVQLDITVKNTATAIDRLKNAFLDHGVKIVIDPDVLKALQEKDQKSLEYLVYAENLSADDVAKMLQELGMADTRGKKGTASPYKQLALSFVPKPQKTLILTMLGINLDSPEPRSRGSEGVNPAPRAERRAVMLPVRAAQPSADVRQFASKQSLQPGTMQVLFRIHI